MLSNSKNRTTSLFLFGLFAAVSMAKAAEQTIVLTEHLNNHWQREFVSYPFEAEEGTCKLGSVQLSGSKGPIPVQLYNIKLWSDTDFVKSADLAFVVDELEPLATNTYTVSYRAKEPKGAKPETDLKILVGEDQVTVESTLFGVRLLLGEKSYDSPLPPEKVPGPVLGMRLTDGTWFGGSRLFGTTPITGYSAQLTDAGSVFARVKYTYYYANGNTKTVICQLNAQASCLKFSSHAAEQQLGDGWDILLTDLPPLAFQFMPEHAGAKKQTGARQIGLWKEREIDAYPAGLVSYLTPWGDWVNEETQTTLHIAFLDTWQKTLPPDPDDLEQKIREIPYDKRPDARELVIKRVDAGAWMTPPNHPGNVVKSRMPLRKDTDGTLFLRVSNHSAGIRRWTLGENSSFRAKLDRALRPSNVMQDDLEDLNVVKDMILEWPKNRKHPRLFLNPDEMAEGLKSQPDVAKHLLNVNKLRKQLGSYVFFDTMRQAGDIICLYDAIIDSDLVTPSERKVLRAQMAYLAYRLASPANWSPERGYKTGNPNMTVAHVLNQGLIACVLNEHPMAQSWSEKPIDYMNRWLNKIDSAGHWPESAGYARVSESKFVFYAIAAQRAGLHDFLADERFKRMVMYFERTLTPPDPQRTMRHNDCAPRVTPPYGRGGNGSSIGIGGMVAKATAESDPDFSKIMQWSYKGTCFSTHVGEPMAGYEKLLLSRTLPTERPDWQSELLPSVGALFRNGVGTPDENYLLLVSKFATNPDGEIWPSEVGALTLWFEHGQPLTRIFPAGRDYANLHGLMLNRVMLATNYKPGKSTANGYRGEENMFGFATLPRLNYIAEHYHWRGTWSGVFGVPKSLQAFPPVKRAGVIPKDGVNWKRQALYVRATEPGGKNYLVLRDTITGGQPTQWQFWTLSRGLTSLSESKERENSELNDKINDLFIQDSDNTKLSEMKMDAPVVPEPIQIYGDRFLAAGQFELDIDYFIASPKETPRHTMQHTYDAKTSAAVSGFRCTQDLMHLQLYDDGNYFVALVPKSKDEPSPAFTTMADGTVIKVSGTFGTDYNFLVDQAREAKADDVRFSGTAASVQDRSDGLVLALAAEGTVTYKDYGIAASVPIELSVSPKTLTLILDMCTSPSKVTVKAPGNWSLETGEGITMSKLNNTTHELIIPAGVTTARLVRR